jgi:hypothetical protein
VATNSGVQGSAELRKTLEELGDMQSSDWKSTMRAAVRAPMMRVRRRALVNLSAISPGKTPLHKTYLGRMVTAGFAYRNVLLKVKLYPRQGAAVANLGVAKEAFYVLSFFELGTSTIPRHPWLTPALEESTDSAVKEVGVAMRRRIEQIAKKRAAKGAGK